MANKYVIGALVLVILASSIYIMMPENVKILVDNTKTTFSVWENGSWQVSGIETSKVYNGTKLIPATTRLVLNDVNETKVNMWRLTVFNNKSIVMDKYEFDGSITDKELFPISETHTVSNAKGLIYQYQVTKLIWNGGNVDLSGSNLNAYSFGRNMKVEWEGHPYFAKITQQINGYGTLTLKWRVASNIEVYNIRLFDPPITADRVMPKLIYNKADITSGEAIFEYCNPTINDVDYDDKKIKFSFNKVKGDFNTFDILVGTKANISVDNQVWISNITTSEKTDGNGTKYNESKDNGKYNVVSETKEIIEYSPLESSAKKIKSNECKNILIKGTWDAAVNGKAISIDWIPEIEISGVKFKQDKFAWWNTSFAKTRRITLTGNSSVLNDYQVYMNLTNTTNMNITGQDLRATYEDNTTALSCWIENNTQVTWFGVWCKTNQTSINLWYGNPSATSTSDDNNTFIIPMRISTLTQQTDARVTNTTAYNINLTTLSNNYVNVYQNISSGSNLSIVARFKGESLVSASWEPRIHYYWNSGNWTGLGVGQGVNPTANGQVDVTNAKNGVVAFGINSGSKNIPINTWYWLRYDLNETNLTAFYSSVVGIPKTSDWTRMGVEARSPFWSGAPTAIIIGKGYGDGGTYPIPFLANDVGSGAVYSNYFDNVTARKTMSTEPTASIGAEESSPPPLITLYFNGTSSDRFYELGETVNVTACADVAGTTTFISSNHPNIGSGLNGTTINGTTCATYIWNTSTVVINQFNNSATSQNHSANNISGITIHSVTDLQSGVMYLRGYSSNENYRPEEYSGFDTPSYGVDGNFNDTLTATFLSTTPTYYNSTTRAFSIDYTVGGANAADVKNIYIYNYTASGWTLLLSQTGTTGDRFFSNNTNSSDFWDGNKTQIKLNGTGATPALRDIYFSHNNVPFNLSIDVGNDGILDYWMPYSSLNDTYAISNRFKTNSLTKSLNFPRGGTNVTYVDLPCGATANSMSWNVSGGNGTINLTKVNNLNTPQNFVFSTENSSNTIDFYYPKSSTVNRHNITITGHPYYSATGTLSGGFVNNAPQSSGGTYKTTASNAYDGTITMGGSMFYSSGSPCTNHNLQFSLIGDSGTKATCTTGTFYGCYTYISGSCSATITGKQPIENVWVTVSETESGLSWSPGCRGGGTSCPVQDGYQYIATWFNSLNQYNINNATNITIWYNGTTMEYQNLNELNSSVNWNINLSTTNINSYLSTCTQDPCPVHYVMKTTKRGNITVTAVEGNHTNSISNITFDVANDGVIDGSISGATISNNNITINATGLNAINTYMMGTCLNRSLPIVATSATAGTESLSSLILNYSINPIALNMTAMKNYMSFNKTLTINDSADSYGFSGGSGTNYGTETTTISGVNVISQTYRSYFMFDLSSIPANMSITFANMSIWASSYVNDAAQTMDAYNTSNNWNETGITWNNAPSSDTLQDSVNLTESGKWYSWNVINATSTAYKNTTNKNMSILIIQSPEGGNKRYEFTSKEGTASRVPKLEIKYVPSTGNINVPIKYTADNWGILNTYSLSINALTDYNYTFLGWAVSATSNMTKTLKLIWSNYTRTFSGNTKEPVFIGTSLAKQNITPFGQTSTRPGINFTYRAREQCMNISMYTNATYACMNITISTTSNKTDGRFFNTTNPNNFITNFCNGTAGLWIWADKDASCAQQIRPYWWYNSKCGGCA